MLCSRLATRLVPTGRLRCLLPLSRGCVTSARTTIGEPLATLRLRIATHPVDTIQKGMLLQWIDQLSTVALQSTSAASAASPLARSLLVGAAVGATTPLFMLLPCSIGLVPVAMWTGVAGVTAALDLILPGLLNTPIALANFTGATVLALCREGWLHLRRASLTAALHRHGMLIGGAAGALTPFLAVGWASALVAAGVLEPVILAMAVWHELVPWSYTAGFTVVTIPMGAGGGAMIAACIAPYFTSSASALKATVLLLGGWAALTAFAGLPILHGDGQAFVRAVVEIERAKDENDSKKWWWQRKSDRPVEDAFNEFCENSDPAITTKWKVYIQSYTRKLERMDALIKAKER